MKRVKTILLNFVFGACLLAGTSVSIAQRVNIELFNSDNGLPQSFAKTIIQDSVGYLWVGTQEGLCRYDGYEFLIYSNDPYDSTTLSNNYIQNIEEGNDGVLWIATYYGLNKYDRHNNKFKAYLHLPNDSRSLSSNKTLRVYKDKSNRIWVKTIDALHLYNPKTDDFTKFKHYNDIFNISQSNDVNPIFEDSRGNLWLGTKDGLFLFDKERLLFKRFHEEPGNRYSLYGNRVNAIVETEKGLLVGTDKGISVYNYKSGSFSKFKVNVKSSEDRRLIEGIQYLGLDSDSSLWVGSLMGLAKVLPNGDLLKYNNLYFNNERVELINVSSVLRDRSGVVWVASQNGLVKINPFTNRISGYSKDVQGKKLFSNNIIASISLDNNGNIWLGTWGTGLHVFNPKTGLNKRYTTNGPNYIPDDFIHSLLKLRNGDIVIGTRNGVFVHPRGERNIVDLFEYKGIYVGDLFRNNRIYSIAEDSIGRFWLATHNGLHRVGKQGVVSFYAFRRDSLSLLSNEVYDVLVDKDGSVWVATSKGVSYLNESLDRIKHCSISAKDVSIQIEALCLYQSMNGLIWIGSTSGLYWINPKDKAKKVHKVSFNGLKMGLVNDIQEDSRGRIWLSTNKGLISFNPLSNLIRTYGKRDGLFSNELNINSSFKDVKGYLYFGGIDGVNIFHPDSIPLNTVAPNISISKVSVYSKSSSYEIIPYKNSRITLPDNFSNITFTLTALDFVHPELNSYRYRLVGHDNRWIELGASNKVSFSNLPQGNYIFQIMGANSDKVWTKEFISLEINVVAPWYRTKFAISFYIFVLLLTFVVTIIRRNRNVKRVNRLLQEREAVLEALREQKEELALKNKNITDSINYAKRIQDSMLPSISHFKQLVPESFVIYRPKDIVSGDFYWINETRNKTFIAVVDCTGHGVPGAFMSIIGIELLRNITNIEGVDDASEILNRLSIAIHNTFATSNGENTGGIKVKDGMDVSFCIIDKEYNMLQFAGAFSNLFLVRDGRLIEIRGDRYSVGMANELGHSLFSSYYIPIQPKDMIYMFTDGIVDQFGGPEGKKFKYRRFRHLLLSNYMKPIEEQRKSIEKAIDDWKGDLEQVDDMLIIGVKPDLSCLF
ncbi:two-component regulator propeller domain-containing protein [Tenuifilum sp.]|uniref:two-component regulator propeller domain-containing protein n=1 Tax=Tenuifilum sp. TaxID=2760880 RepID=UPI002584B810|nr:two-component regulator propeller domain-containing protein [Tenuifilum sp.]